VSLTLRVRPVHLALCALLFLSSLPPALGVGAAHAASSRPPVSTATPAASPRAAASPLSTTATTTATASLSPATPVTALPTITVPVSPTSPGATRVTATASATTSATATLGTTMTPTTTMAAARPMAPSPTVGGTGVPTRGTPLYYPWVAPPATTTHASQAAPFAVVNDSLGWNSALTALPQGRRGPAAAVGQDGNVYVFGGQDDGTGIDYNTTYSYHPASNSWATGASMPISVSSAQAVTLPDGRIVVLGGGTGCYFSNPCHVTNAVNAYDPRTDTWSALPPMLSPRYNFAAVVLNGSIYAIGGWDGGAELASMERYDPGSNTWSLDTSLPQVTEAPGAAVDGQTIYVVGGYDATTKQRNTMYLYHAGVWSAGPALPTARANLSAARGADGRIYAIGGYNPAGGFLATVEAYNPPYARWDAATPLPTAAGCLAAVSTPRGQIYAIGGNYTSPQVAIYGPTVALTSDGGAPGSTTTLAGSGFSPGGSVAVTWGGAGGPVLARATADGSGAVTQTVTIPVGAAQGDNTLTAQDVNASYPVTTSFAGGGLTWDTTLTALPGARRAPTAALGLDDNIYVFGGTDGNSIDYATTYIYHPPSDTWTTGAPLPTGVASARAVTLPDGRIVVLGGGTGCFFGHPPCGVTNAVTAYDPRANTWSALAPMLSPRDNFAAVVLNGRIYAIGGWDGSQNLSSVEVYNPTANSWSAAPSLPQAEQGLAAAAGPDGRIYVAGGGLAGADGKLTTAYNSLFIFDGATWRTGPPLPNALVNLGVTPFNATLGPDGRIYVIGGYHGIFGLATGWYAEVDAYNPRANSWGRATSLPGPIGEMGLVTTRNAQIVVLGGADGGQRGAPSAQVSMGTISFALGGSIPWHPHQSVRMADGLNATVDLADGHADVSASALSIPARGPDLSLSHIWDSRRAANGDATAAGQGWSDTLTPSMGGVLTQTVSYTDSAGTRWLFPYYGSASGGGPYSQYDIPPGQPWVLATSPITSSS